MRGFAALLLLCPACLVAQKSAAALAQAVREAGLDAGECYRVRELNFAREDLRIYLTDGFLVLGKPVDGLRTSALFTANVEGGDAELIVMPPRRSERMSLASFTESPNLNEHFKSAVMIFTDETADLLASQIQERGFQKHEEMGLLLASEWNSVVRNLSASFEVRLVQDLLSERRAAVGFFYAAVSGTRHGNFDVVYDPRGPEQISIGQLVYRDERAFFDNWATFEAQSYRNGSRKPPGLDFSITRVHLEATLEKDLQLRVRTRATVVPQRSGEGALSFEISRRMRVTEARVNGEPAEVFQRESLRANLIRGQDNELLLVVPASPLPPGVPHEVEILHEGAVVSSAGNQVYYVGARGTWYPQHSLQFAQYEIIFRYPRNLDLVATGEIVSDRTEGDWRITHRRTSSPIRLAGFNLGEYECATSQRGGFNVEVYANRRVESALQPRPRTVILPAPPVPSWPRSQRFPPDVLAVPLEPSPPNPLARLQNLASEVASALEFMATHFGPPPLKTLTVAPIPGAFGQGFPGLVYLSTLSYLDPKERPISKHNELQQTFFNLILHAHETAHQWWGNVVTSASFRDDWLMEALANYSALLFLEKTRGTRSLDLVLASYKENLLAKDGNGRPIDAAGPISWGARLNSSQSPSAWRVITYEKGSWIMHMLRRRLGDQKFLSMLGELIRRYRNQPVSTEQFRQLARQYLPPNSPDPDLENFFDRFVYGTGIPELRLRYSVRGSAPKVRLSGSVTQTGVPQDFSVDVPVEIQFGRGRAPVIHWVRTSNDPVTFTLSLRSAPTRVLLDPASGVLAVKK